MKGSVTKVKEQMRYRQSWFSSTSAELDSPMRDLLIKYERGPGVKPDFCRRVGMEAKVENREGVFVVSLSGQMNFESADNLKTNCLKSFTNESVIFNLQELSFVGSSGITPFLELLAELSKVAGSKFKICSVGVEFMRLFETGTVDGIEIYRDVQDAHRAFTSPDIQAMARLIPFGLKLTIE